MKPLLTLILVLSAAPAWAVPIGAFGPSGTYNLITDEFPCGFQYGCELTGSFQYDAALAVTNPDGTANNPIVAWQFQYNNPELAIHGQQWSTSDGGHFVPTGSNSLIVTNVQNSTLTFQLCYIVCGPDPNNYGANIYDNNALLRYSTGGIFALSEPLSMPGNPGVSVPEPSTFWLTLLGLGGLAGVAGWKRRAASVSPASS